MAPILTITVRHIRLDGSETPYTVSVPAGTTLRNVLQQARAQGARFVYGRVVIRNRHYRLEDMESRITSNEPILFIDVERAQYIDLDALDKKPDN